MCSPDCVPPTEGLEHPMPDIDISDVADGRRLAAALFNRTWTLLEKRALAAAEDTTEADLPPWSCDDQDGSSSSNSVSCSPAGASSRALSEFHGVGVGWASTVAPDSASRAVAAAASAT